MKIVIMGDDLKAQRLLDAFNSLRRVEWHKMPQPHGNCKLSEVRVLFFIKQGLRTDPRGVTISTLSSLMGVTSPTITPLIKNLESNGLVLRLNDQEDRRVVRVQLTETGEEFIRKAIGSLKERFQGIYNFLGEEKSAQLAELLEQVHQYILERQKEERNV
ncbi:MarR family winged helix-turn-helix transcriptional regulator [Paenibacillus segetis]|uniref:Transcriptional regulator n=1 Tax=Paenibacillus segetis TaxID=1325360 RepID=A0ABQ1YP43_9BACL|nr:MarR family transcriptional regulator [Paenibacillus segetis]GGH32356.1 transcriptional regulator [Paenibacillus segetis]